MKKIVYIFLILITVSNCSQKKVTKHHGKLLLEKKQNLLVINRSNKNDIIKILGYPSATSKFDQNTLIYIERKNTQSEFKNLGMEKIFKNDVLVLKIDQLGILKEKKLLNLNDFNNIEIADARTVNVYQKNSFTYKFFSSLRQKINDPLGTRAKKSKEISQR